MALLILDRDGVINQDSDDYVKSADEWIPIPGSIEAMARLSQAGYQIAIATNQSGLGRGYFQQSDLDAMHVKMMRLLDEAGGKLAGIFFCPHTPDANCDCRKPKAGLIAQIEQALNCSAQNAFIVGDSLRDLEAGLLKNCTPLLVKTGKGERTIKKLQDEPVAALNDLLIFDDLAASCDFLLAQLK